MKKKRVYFAHPINTYGTALEQTILDLIAQKWRGDRVVNPSDPAHARVVAHIKAKNPTANVMPYFLALARSSTNVVVLPFPDGKWGTGVYDEASEVLNLKEGKYVWVVDPKTCIIRFVPELDPTLKLSVEETRARIRFPDGSTRPYE